MPEFEHQQRQTWNSPSISPAKPDRTMEAENPVRQQTWGNQAAQRFAQSCPARLPSPGACPFGGACHACPAPVQAKLKVNAPGDEYEQEADRVAGQVIRMPEPRVQRQVEPEEEEEEPVQAKPLAERITPLVQRQAEPEEDEEEEPVQTKLAEGTQVQQQAEPEEEEEEEEEEPVQTKPLIQRQTEPEEEEEESIQTKRTGERTPHIGSALAAQIHSLRGGGQPLSRSMRSFFEPRFGRDFNQVRIHTDANAIEMAKSLKARAFTKGHDIAFSSDQYRPETHEGQQLLAHELTHIVQQSGASTHTPSIQRAEIDDRKSGCVGLRDIQGDIDSKVNGLLKSLTNEPDGKKRAKAVYDAMGKGSPYTKIENWLYSLPQSKQRRIKIAQTKYRIKPFRYSPRGASIDVPRHRSGSGRVNAWRWKGEKTLGVLINVAGQCVGSDKLGHFFQQGYDYFKVSKLLGKGDIYAKGFGQWLEGRFPAHRGILLWLAQMTKKGWPGFDKVGPFWPAKVSIYTGVFGLGTTGVYSRADLQANEAGLQFYKSVYASPNAKFSIRSYITGQWRETLNPSCYNRDMATVVAANDPQFQAEVRRLVKIALEQNRLLGIPGLSRREGMRIYYYILQKYIKKYQCKPGLVPVPVPPRRQKPPPRKPVPPKPPKKTPPAPGPDHRGTTSILWFKFNSTVLREDKILKSSEHMKMALLRIRQHLAKFGDKARIVLHGYASVEGDPGYNLRLSRRRAEAIRQKLHAAGIPADKTSIKAHGVDSTFPQRAYNRRVEIEHIVVR